MVWVKGVCKYEVSVVIGLLTCKSSSNSTCRLDVYGSTFSLAIGLYTHTPIKLVEFVTDNKREGAGSFLCTFEPQCGTKDKGLHRLRATNLLGDSPCCLPHPRARASFFPTQYKSRNGKQINHFVPRTYRTAHKPPDDTRRCALCRMFY